MLQIQRRFQHLDDVRDRLGIAMRDALAHLRQRTGHHWYGVSLYSPSVRIRSHVAVVPQLKRRLEQRVQAVLAFQRHVIQALAGAMDNLSPLAILARGYSLVQTVHNGRIIKKATELSVGDDIQVRLSEGRLICDVRDVWPDPPA
jgi:exodeoxyribonuclease VII large subunit